MTERVTRKTVTFSHPFELTYVDDKQPAGTYTIETIEEPMTQPRYYVTVQQCMSIQARDSGSNHACLACIVDFVDGGVGKS